MTNADESGDTGSVASHSGTPFVEGVGIGATETGRASFMANWASILGGIVVVVGAAVYISMLRHDLDQSLSRYAQLCESIEDAEADILDSMIRTARVIGPAVVNVDLSSMPNEALDRHNAAVKFFEAVKDWPLSSETQDMLRTVRQGDTKCG